MRPALSSMDILQQKGKVHVVNYNFRGVPKAMQSTINPSFQLECIMVAHLIWISCNLNVNQVNHLMQLMLANKGIKSPEDHVHIAGIVLCFLSKNLNILAHGLQIQGYRPYVQPFKPYAPCNIFDLSSSYIPLPSSSTIEITHIGSVTLSPFLTFHHMLFVPSFNYNMLSISKLIKDSSCIVSCYHDKCLFSQPEPDENLDSW